MIARVLALIASSSNLNIIEGAEVGSKRWKKAGEEEGEGAEKRRWTDGEREKEKVGVRDMGKRERQRRGLHTWESNSCSQVRGTEKWG